MSISIESAHVTDSCRKNACGMPSLRHKSSHTYLDVIPAAQRCRVELRAVVNELLPGKGVVGYRTPSQSWMALG
jgi:hypothetical protein